MNIRANYTILIAFLLLLACNKEQLNIGIDDPGQYSKVYMPRANENPILVALAIKDTTYSFPYSAYLGGTVTPDADINIKFGIVPSMVDSFNLANGTAYQLMPAASYSLETENSVIPAGSRSSNTLHVQVKPKGFLQPFESYLLPISITASDGATRINNGLSTIYFVITGAYANGEVPRQKVLSLGQHWGKIFAPGARGCLIRNDNANDIFLYTPDAQGNFSAAPRVIAVNWAASESFYYVSETRLVVRNYPYWAGLFSFKIEANHDLIGADPFWLGDFWDRFVIVPYMEYFLTIDQDGNLWRQPTLSEVNAPKTKIGTGFGGFKQVMAYQHSLLALENNGRLWIYPMSADAVPGSRREIGSGWDLYEKVIVSGNDLLALDAAGDVYRYKFDTRGFFPLK